MKAILFALISLMTLDIASANNQTCYVISPADARRLPVTVPSQICFEKISVDLDKAKVSVSSTTHAKLFNKFTLIHLSRKNEDAHSFTAYNVFYAVEQSTCGEGETLELLISGLVNNYGEAIIPELKVSVEQQLTRDTCHLEPQVKEFNYILQ